MYDRRAWLARQDVRPERDKMYGENSLKARTFPQLANNGRATV